MSFEKEQDDIEYNITFPTPNGNEIEPVVFLLGWYGAKDKYLSKYCDIWANEGCTTIRYIHKSSNIFFQDPATSKSLRYAAKKLLQLLDDYGLRSNPVLIHTFSNGGYFIYYHLADLIEMEEVNMIGAVFDSCPARLDILSGARAIYYSGKMSLLVSILTILGFTLYSLFFKLFQFFSNKNDIFQNSAEHRGQRWPGLYLYSSADVIVPSRFIKEMFGHRGAVSASYMHDFQTSPHCMHYKVHPEVYLNKCVEFLSKCLEDFDENLT